MAYKSETLKHLIRLLKVLPKRRRKSLLLLLPVAFVAGISDFLVVALVTRLLNVVVGVSNNPSIPYAQLGIDAPGNPQSKIFLLLCLYIISVWLSAFIKLILKGSQSRLKAKIWRDLSEIAHEKILDQKYEYFLGTNNTDISATVLMNISRVADVVVLPLLQVISGFFVVTFISLGVLIISKPIALVLIFSLLIGYTSISILITPFLKRAAIERIKLEIKTNTVMSESLRTIIDLQMTNSEKYFHNKYKDFGRSAIPYIWKAEALPEAPRALIEPLGITLIFAAAFVPLIFTDKSADIVKMIPFLATIAFASLKLTPPLQDTFRGITSLRSSLPDLIVTLKLIGLKDKRYKLNDVNVPSPIGISPREFIKLKNLYYQYPNTKDFVIKNINLTIKVGSRVAFVGKTGSGKTTTVNQLIGLLRPTKGEIEIDGITVNDKEVPAWQACCAYVPQTITLLNSNVLENVAYGLKEDQIDFERVWESLEIAKLADLISGYEKGLYTGIGENGIKLSGGQRQRVVLARAFYRKAKLLVLDEATSALDNKTESEIMKSVEVLGRGCTTIVIAHRLSTVMNADKIYEFENGKIKDSGSFEELVKSSESFYETVKAGKELINDKKIKI